MKHLAILLLALSVSAVYGQPYKWKRLSGPNGDRGTIGVFSGPQREIFSITSPFFGYHTPSYYPNYADGLGYSVSNDGGKSWEFKPVVTYPLEEPAYWRLVIGSKGEYYYNLISNRSTDYPYIGLFRSTNKGSNWTQVFSGSGQLTQGTDSSLIYNKNDTIYFSIDHGYSWVSVAKIYTRVIGGFNKYLFFEDYSSNVITRYSLRDNTYTTLASGLQSNSNPTLIASNLLVAYAAPYIIATDGVNGWDTIKTLVDAFPLSSGVLALSKGAHNGIVATVLDHTGYVYALQTFDRGKQWDTVILPRASTQIPTYDITINFSDSEAYYYADETGIYLSTDRGLHWKNIGMPYEDVNDIIVTENNRIFANPTQRFSSGIPFTGVTVSSDGGDSWQRSEGDNIVGPRIGHGPGDKVFAVGLASQSESAYSVWLYDSSLTTFWKKRATLNKIKSDAVIATNRTNDIYISSVDNIYRSDDLGLTWESINPPNTGANIFSLDVNSENIIYFGSAPAMYRSEDRGTTWIKLRPVDDPVRLSYIKTFDKDGVLLGTEGAGLLLSTDKGNNWTRIDGNNFDTVTCIAVNSKGEVAAGTNRGLWTSDVTKQQWTKVTLGNDANLYIGGIDVAKNDDFYVGTYGSSVWMGTRNYNSANFATERSTTLKIFPNPASGNVTISLPNDESKIELYDILGRKISVLNESDDEQLHFNTSHLSSGIYTVCLRGRTNETQKLIVNH
jgi:photosystem II stability/assembly factor-like uncharacterized protein